MRVYFYALTPDFLNRQRERSSVADVVSRWVKWDARKSNPDRDDYWAPCPFHEEISASFHVDDKKGYYYCFGCQAKGDALGFIKEKRGLTFMEAVRQLAFLYGLDEEFAPKEHGSKAVEPINLLQIKDIVVEHFDQENFLEVGVLTGWTSQIRNHNRLLRSLSWGDPDYPGNVLDIITRMDDANDGSIVKLRTYVGTKFTSQTQAISEVEAFSAAKRSLGYNFVPSKNNVIGVMMPFGGSFNHVYSAIKGACEATPLPASRAGEVWNHSVLVNDILELINHSAVVICDLTGRNENVFYELGIAHAWGKPVIPITQNSEDVPFDLRHHRYLTYLNNKEGLNVLERDLSDKLKSLVGEKSWS